MCFRVGRYAFFDGCDEWKVKRPPICCSKTADHFLHKYGYSSANEVGENGMRPLHYAAFEGSVAAVSALVAAGAEVDCRDVADFPRGGGCTPS